MKKIKTKEAKHLQTPGERMLDKEFVTLVSKAEKSRFMTLKEHQEAMDI